MCLCSVNKDMFTYVEIVIDWIYLSCVMFDWNRWTAKATKLIPNLRFIWETSFL